MGLKGNVAIQRKTTTDLVRSIEDKTIWHDLEILKSLEEEGFKTKFLVEGSLWRVQKFTKFPLNSLLSVIHSIETEWQISTTWMSGEYYTAIYLGTYALYLGRPKEEREFSLRPKPRLETLPQKVQFLIEGLPDISGTLAKRLLSHFGSARKVFQATKEELEKVEGIGSKKAEQIIQVLDYQWDIENRGIENRGIENRDIENKNGYRKKENKTGYRKNEKTNSSAILG